jgi:hypothetical protein
MVFLGVDYLPARCWKKWNINQIRLLMDDDLQSRFDR